LKKKTENLTQRVNKYWRDTEAMTAIVSSLAKKTEIPISASRIYINKKSKEN